MYKALQKCSSLAYLYDNCGKETRRGLDAMPAGRASAGKRLRVHVQDTRERFDQAAAACAGKGRNYGITFSPQHAHRLPVGNASTMESLG
jgi:hypothetical protein